MTAALCDSPARDLARFWALAWIGNLIGGTFFVALPQQQPPADKPPAAPSASGPWL